MLLGPDVLPWQMRWQGRPAITPPDTVWDRSMAIPMVAPAPSGASDDKRKHAQEPPQERTEDTVENTDTGRATPDDITVDIAALSVRAADDLIGSQPTPILVNNAQSQATQHRNTAFNSPVAFVAYETTVQPGRPPRDDLEDFATAAEALAYVNDPANEAELRGEDTHTAQEPPQAEIETYADFLAAAYGPDLDDPDDGSEDDLSDPAYREFILNATKDELAEYEAATAQEPPQAEIETYADFLTAAYGPKSDDSDDEH